MPRDLGETAENSSGGGRRGLLREIAVLAGLTFCAVLVLYLLAGWMTDWAVARISPEKEAVFFEGMFVAEFAEPVPEELAGKWALAESIFDKVQSAPGVVPLSYRLAYSYEAEPNAVYGDRKGAARLFEILEADSELPKWAYMFLSHPANVERIREIHSDSGTFGAMTDDGMMK